MPSVKVEGGQGFGDFAGGFSDIFEEFFGGGFGGSIKTDEGLKEEMIFDTTCPFLFKKHTVVKNLK